MLLCSFISNKHSNLSINIKDQESLFSLQNIINVDDDIPTTSKQAAAVTATISNRVTHSPGVKFKKFVDDSKKKSMRRSYQPRMKRLNNTTNTSTASQIATRKLLKSIRRRQNCKFVNNMKPRRIGLEMRRQLNFSQEKILNVKQINGNVTLEEGEIVSENESTQRDDKNIAATRKSDPENNENDDDGDGDGDSEKDSEEDSEEDSDQDSNHDDDDDDDEDSNDDDSESDKSKSDEDCVYIAPQVELITIEDETEQPTVPYHKSIIKKSQLITSTPLEKPKLKVNTDIIKIDDENPSLFFKDSSGGKLFETITSSDNFSHSENVSTLRARKRNIKPRSWLRRRKRMKTVDVTVVDSTPKNDDIILLDDCTLKPLRMVSGTSRRLSRIKKSINTDDSVIFVSESNPNRLEFIPLVSDDVPNPIRYESPPRPQKTTKVQNQQSDLFTKSERKELNVYNENAYNPSASDGPKEAGKRMVLIDGCNVAFNHSLNKGFSVKGLKICLEYFEKMGHDVKAIVPQFRLNKYKSTDPDELSALHSAGKIVLTPCKNLPGVKSASYDDRFVLQLACELDAAIVSNDNYRDLINENSAFKKIIENRVIGYTWCNDIFILPKDPYGKWGPDLQTILNRK